MVGVVSMYMYVIIGEIHCMSCCTFRLYIHYIFILKFHILSSSSSSFIFCSGCLYVGISTYNGWIFSKKLKQILFSPNLYNGVGFHTLMVDHKNVGDNRLNCL